MKQCPQCERTYADETISFCLADGQLLSPSYGSAATLPLTPARATDGAATLILPVALTPERAQKIMRRNLIAGAVGVPVGVIIMLIQFSNIPDSANQPIATLILAAALSGLIYGYMFWSAFWGYPTVWRWWRTPITKLYKFASRLEFNWIVTMVFIVAGLCALVPALAGVFLYFYSFFWVTLFYSFFGGGIYQFLQARKIAKQGVVSER